MDKEEKFKVLTDDGKEIECDVLLTFDLEETNKHYVVYTDNTVDSEGNTNVYASCYENVEGKDNVNKLSAIETEKEWKIIDIILKKAEEQINGN